MSLGAGLDKDLHFSESLSYDSRRGLEEIWQRFKQLDLVLESMKEKKEIQDIARTRLGIRARIEGLLLLNGVHIV